VILMGLPLYVIWFFSLTAFNIFSLVSVLVVLMIICHGDSCIFVKSCLVSWRLSVPKWA
jgi:hypothetical protein